jgi:hypothetical protein
MPPDRAQRRFGIVAANSAPVLAGSRFTTALGLSLNGVIEMPCVLPGKRCGIVLALFLATPAAILPQHVHAATPGHASCATAPVGTIVFPNSGTAAAQTSFLRGVALLHSFSYDRAREAFQKAERIDPKFALAY